MLITDAERERALRKKRQLVAKQKAKTAEQNAQAGGVGANRADDEDDSSEEEVEEEE